MKWRRLSIMLIVTMAILITQGCEDRGKSISRDISNGSNQDTQVLEEMSRRTGIILPASGVVLLRADDGGGRDPGIGYYRWAVYCPSALAMPPFQAAGINGYLDMPLQSTVKVIEDIVGKGNLGKSKAAFSSEWQTNNFEYRGTLLRSSEGDYLVVEQFKKR